MVRVLRPRWRMFKYIKKKPSREGDIRRGIDIFFRVQGIIVVSVDKAASSGRMDAENGINLGKKTMQERWKARAISTLCETPLPPTATVRYAGIPLFLPFSSTTLCNGAPWTYRYGLSLPSSKSTFSGSINSYPSAPAGPSSPSTPIFGVPGGERDSSDVGGRGASGVASFATSADG
jgi:hypothetical protein